MGFPVVSYGAQTVWCLLSICGARMLWCMLSLCGAQMLLRLAPMMCCPSVKLRYCAVPLLSSNAVVSRKQWHCPYTANTILLASEISGASYVP
eukprot:scaffold253761_cov18-Tisochrysis_lutea.AAC.1